jgi:hypothetical protein
MINMIIKNILNININNNEALIVGEVFDLSIFNNNIIKIEIY